MLSVWRLPFAEAEKTRRSKAPALMIGGGAAQHQLLSAMQHEQGTLLWLISIEGNRLCKKMVRWCSRKWHLSPEEVCYVSNRFYEFVTDYHFAVTAQEFLYGRWPIQPLKSLPGEAALASVHVQRILAGDLVCLRGEAAKIDLEKFHRQYIELMVDHYRERRILVSRLLNPPRPPRWLVIRSNIERQMRENPSSFPDLTS